MNFLRLFDSNSPEKTFYFVIALFFVLLLLFLYIYKLNRRINRLLGNKSGVGSIEQGITDTLNRTSNLERFQNETENYLLSVEKRLRKSIQQINTVRFNPFKGTGSGGNQSFATAFINENGSGIVISSLYSRGGHVSIFSKPIIKFESEFELTPEEKEALDKAKEEIKK